MSEYTMFFSKIENCSPNMKKITPVMNTNICSIRRIMGNLCLSGSAQSAIKQSLKVSIEKLEQNSKSVKGMADNLDKAVSLYKNTEQTIMLRQKLSNIKLPKSQGSIESGSKETKEGENSAAVWKKSAGIVGTILGMKSAGEASVNLLGGSWNGKFTSGIKYDEDGKLSSVSLISGSVSAEGHCIQGGVKGNIGPLMGSVKGTAGKISAKGEVGVTLYKDGKLAPQIGIGGELSAVGVEGEAEVGLGTENNNIHGKASGKVGAAKVKGEAGVGKITYETDSGEKKTGYGVKGEVRAEAYAAEGTVSGGVEIFGIKIDVGLTGKAGGGGVKVGGYATTGGVSGSFHGGLGLGAGIDVSIDWTGFKLGW